MQSPLCVASIISKMKTFFSATGVPVPLLLALHTSLNFPRPITSTRS